MKEHASGTVGDDDQGEQHRVQSADGHAIAVWFPVWASISEQEEQDHAQRDEREIGPGGGGLLDGSVVYALTVVLVEAFVGAIHPRLVVGQLAALLSALAFGVTIGATRTSSGGLFGRAIGVGGATEADVVGHRTLVQESDQQEQSQENRGDGTAQQQGPP